MSGYVAAVALRAAAPEVPPELEPASFTCQFLAPPRFEPVDIDVRVRRISRRAAAVAVSITQDAKPILDAQSWFALPSEVVQHDYAVPHPHGHPDDHPFISQLIDEPPPFPFWNNFEGKPIDWIEDWDSYAGGPPEWAEWLRFVPTAAFADPVLEAARLVLLADLPSFPAAVRAHPGPRTFVSPSLDLAVQLHRLDTTMTSGFTWLSRLVRWPCQYESSSDVGRSGNLAQADAGIARTEVGGIPPGGVGLLDVVHLRRRWR